MANQQQVQDWLKLTRNTLESKMNRSENTMIKQIWEKELKDFDEWTTSYAKPTK